ncbi:hypothetical protein SBE55_14000 [Mycolicibacterium sp. 141076]|uniref:hypothetical protein n=1 Tax=Mycobacteriaceae TaxID=1762 RepID=UPI00299ECEA9|nr:hypothetical protein [Mycolicibacterium sp. 141076]MDX1878929.1 hypothetical protein [Mycolicibacterium sp. 141076]
MAEIPVTGAVAEYHGQRFRILFSGTDWVALNVGPGVELPDAFARGEAPAEPGHYDPWAKIPRSALDGVIQVSVSATLAGHTVYLRRRLRDGRIGIEFIGPPQIAREMGLDGDQHTGWTGLVDPDRLQDIRVEETRRA